MACWPLVFVFMLVHMNLPFWKSKKVADGFFSLKDSPESCFQLCLEPSNFWFATDRSRPSLKAPVITIFSTVISKSNMTVTAI